MTIQSLCSANITCYPAVTKHFWLDFNFYKDEVCFLIFSVIFAYLKCNLIDIYSVKKHVQTTGMSFCWLQIFSFCEFYLGYIKYQCNSDSRSKCVAIVLQFILIIASYIITIMHYCLLLYLT